MLVMLLAAEPGAAQARLEARVGMAGSTVLVEDLVGSPALRTLLGSALAAKVNAKAATSPIVEAGVQLPLRPGVRFSALASWQPTQLEVEEPGGTRDAQSLHLLGALLEAGFTVRGGPLEVSAGAGALTYRSEDEGIFVDGADLAPLLRLGAAGRFQLGAHRMRLLAFAEGHRFGTPAIRTARGNDGGVVRFGLMAGLVWGGAR